MTDNSFIHPTKRIDMEINYIDVYKVLWKSLKDGLKKKREY